MEAPGPQTLHNKALSNYLAPVGEDGPIRSRFQLPALGLLGGLAQGDVAGREQCVGEHPAATATPSPPTGPQVRGRRYPPKPTPSCPGHSESVPRAWGLCVEQGWAPGVQMLRNPKAGLGTRVPLEWAGSAPIITTHHRCQSQEHALAAPTRIIATL